MVSFLQAPVRAEMFLVVFPLALVVVLAVVLVLVSVLLLVRVMGMLVFLH